MTRLPLVEPAKPKRKGTRSISTLTPTQLARTKEHIERLERELDDLRSKQSGDLSGDQAVQELLRRNKALEEELMRLKENMRVPMTSSPYSASVYDSNLSTRSDAIPNPRGSSFPDDYNSLPDYSQLYVPLPNNCESWATVPWPVPSNVSIPSSSADGYSAGYIPTSVPISTLSYNNTSSSSISAGDHKDVVKMDYDDVDHHLTIPKRLPQPEVRPGEEANHTQCLDAGFRLGNPPLQPGTPHSHPYMSHHEQQQCSWNMYPMYYLQGQSPVH